MTGEQRLYAAVLIQGILDKDKRWLEDGACWEHPFSFVRCCLALRLHPRKVRRALEQGGSGILRLLESWARSQGQRTTGRQVGKQFRRRGVAT